MDHIPVQVQLPAGHFSLDAGEDGRLRWEGPGSPAQPEPGQVLAWACCLGNAGDFHLVLYTATRHLIHCVTQDGQRWSRRGLSRLEREDIALSGLAVAAAPHPEVIYLLTGEGELPVAVLYRSDGRGGWQGQRLALPPAGAAERIRFSPDGKTLYALFRDGGRSRFFLIGPGGAQELFSLPTHPEELQVLELPGGILHTLYRSEGLPWADHFPLESGGRCTDLCLYQQEGQVFCAYRREGRWAVLQLAPEGWQRREDMSPGPGRAVLVLGPGLRQRVPPPPEKAAPQSVAPTTLEQTLRNQALLLTELQQETRQLQQTFFTLQARVQALEARGNSVPDKEGAPLPPEKGT